MEAAILNCKSGMEITMLVFHTATPSKELAEDLGPAEEQ
jgi:hypothetical protein